MIIRWVQIVAIALTLSSQTSANEITITQIGDRLDLDITQKGGNNAVKEYFWDSVIDGDDNTVLFHQEHSNGTSTNVIEYGAIVGKENTVEVRQGSDNLGGNGVRSDSTEYSGHYAHVGIIGDNNKINIGQRNPDNSPHSAWAVIMADGADVEITQGSSSTKDAEVWVENDNSNISVLQDGSGSHTAFIDTYGSDPSTIDLTQGGSTSQSYSLTQYCVTAGGCSVTVTQN